MTIHLYLWLIPLLPFAGFLVNGFLGSRLPKALVSTVALAFPLAAFAVVLRAAQFVFTNAISMPYAENFGGSGSPLAHSTSTSPSPWTSSR
jgi:NADH-quinone oxidoreductase subunit L